MTERKRALITGATGQDGAYLAEFLLSRGYEVHGVKRRSSTFNTERVDHLYQDPHEREVRFALHYGDLTDSTNLIRIVQETQPRRDLQSWRAKPRRGELRNAGIHRQRRRHRHSASPRGDPHSGPRETHALLSGVDLRALRPGAGVPQDETTPFYPRSPYAAAKLYAYWITVNYREAYGMHASNGILFNHESPIRGETFVTRKITRGVAAIHLGQQDCLYLGNLDAMRDWGHARDYVEGMWRIVQQEEGDDYVLATGETHQCPRFRRTGFRRSRRGYRLVGRRGR